MLKDGLMCAGSIIALVVVMGFMVRLCATPTPMPTHLREHKNGLECKNGYASQWKECSAHAFGSKCEKACIKHGWKREDDR